MTNVKEGGGAALLPSLEGMGAYSRLFVILIIAISKNNLKYL